MSGWFIQKKYILGTMQVLEMCCDHVAGILNVHDI